VFNQSLDRGFIVYRILTREDPCSMRFGRARSSTIFSDDPSCATARQRRRSEKPAASSCWE